MFIFLIAAAGVFTLEPPKTMYVEKGGMANFTWKYSLVEGETVLIYTWRKADGADKPYSGKAIILQTPPKDTKPVLQTANTEYYSRTTIVLPYTMKIGNIRLSDEGLYVMAVSYISGSGEISQVKLVVTGTYCVLCCLSYVVKFSHSYVCIYINNNNNKCGLRAGQS